MPTIESIDELEHICSKQLIIPVHQSRYLLLHAKSPYSRDRTRQKVLLLIIPHQLYPLLSISFLQKLFDWFHLIGVVPISDEYHRIVSVILVEDWVESVLMGVSLFVAARVDDYANGKVLGIVIDLVFWLKGVVLLLEGLCALLFWGLGIVEIVFGVFEQLEVLGPLSLLELVGPSTMRYVLCCFGLLALLIVCLSLFSGLWWLTDIFYLFHCWLSFDFIVIFAVELFQKIFKRWSCFRLHITTILTFIDLLIFRCRIIIFRHNIKFQVALNKAILLGLGPWWL